VAGDKSRAKIPLSHAENDTQNQCWLFQFYILLLSQQRKEENLDTPHHPQRVFE